MPRENRKDLREIPKRVLATTRVVLVEHMDEVLREALVLSDPDAVFGKRIPPMEVLHGKVIEPLSEHSLDPAPSVPAPGAQQ